MSRSARGLVVVLLTLSALAYADDPKQATPPVRTDSNGDPLPPGALLRMGKIGSSRPEASVAFSPDSKTLASASGDKTIHLWDTATGKEIRGLNLTKSYRKVHSVAFSPDGKTLASASDDKIIRLWDTATGKETRALKSGEVYSVVFSPDGKTLASGSALWETATGKEILFPNGGQRWAGDWVMAVAFSPDGKTLASAGSDKMLRLWETATGKEIHTLKGHQKAVWSVAFAPDGKTLASASYDTTVRLWGTATGKEIHVLNGHRREVGSVAISPDGKTLASASHDSTLLWETATGKEIRELVGQKGLWQKGMGAKGFVHSVVFSPDGKTLATGNSDTTALIWAVSGRTEAVPTPWQPSDCPLCGPTWLARTSPKPTRRSGPWRRSVSQHE